MLACVDVSYRDDRVVAGCILFRSWADAQPAGQALVECGAAAPYRPGEFYLRELPPLLDVLSRVTTRPELVIVDGYVWLGPDKPGLGARLHAALGGQVPVVGVAKTAWRGSATSGQNRVVAIHRGGSAKPLYVTGAGIDVADAARLVASMHGEYRIPTLLKVVDRLTRRPEENRVPVDPKGGR
jgi:deoxyribonuclease V